ncbi:hypothetical protein CDD83_3854 [Cordyceps sp. RAO-2017]|nr:hypothetical protein CDD83_3854 [Cordyceps sp. RAO-2017]
MSGVGASESEVSDDMVMARGTASCVDVQTTTGLVSRRIAARSCSGSDVSGSGAGAVGEDPAPAWLDESSGGAVDANRGTLGSGDRRLRPATGPTRFPASGEARLHGCLGAGAGEEGVDSMRVSSRGVGGKAAVKPERRPLAALRRHSPLRGGVKPGTASGLASGPADKSPGEALRIAFMESPGSLSSA